MSETLALSKLQIENRIFFINGNHVMIDRDLAEIYDLEVKRLNEQVKRNIERFPESFRFQLSESDKNELVANCDRFKTMKHSTNRPYAFTEQGVAMLSAVLRSATAIQVSIQIINAFVEMRKMLANQNGLIQRVEGVERKLMETDQKFEQVFKALESRDEIPTQGVFFDGQIFDAYELTSRIIRSAKTSIVLIDNYIDETTLNHLAKKDPSVKVHLLCKNLNNQVLLDIQKAKAQYGNFEAITFSQSHDRFLIIDKKEVYHLGASLKDLGKKWFAFSKLETKSVEGIMNVLIGLI
jgi:phage regulator Rha-like protein